MSPKIKLIFILFISVLGLLVIWHFGREYLFRSQSKGYAQTQLKTDQHKKDHSFAAELSNSEQSRANLTIKELISQNNPSLSIDPGTSGSIEANKNFNQSRRCFSVLKNIRSINERIKYCGENDKRVCGESVADLQGKVTDLRNQHPECLNVDIQSLNDLSFQDMAKAAKLGNIEAQVCFIKSNFLPLSFSSRDEINGYVDDAKAYIISGLQRGDWKIPLLLSSPVQGRNHGIMVYYNENAQLNYAMTRLLSLGASGKYADKLNSAINYYIQNNADPEVNLTQQQISEADMWAENAYSKFYSKSPVLTEAPDPCPP